MLKARLDNGSTGAMTNHREFVPKAGEDKNDGDGPDRSDEDDGGGIGDKAVDTTNGGRTGNTAGRVGVNHPRCL